MQSEEMSHLLAQISVGGPGWLTSLMKLLFVKRFLSNKTPRGSAHHAKFRDCIS
jgi:hypothetical protein